MFGCHGKHYFPENDFRLTANFPFDPEIIYSPHFHFKLLPEKERERERGMIAPRRVDCAARPTIAPRRQTARCTIAIIDRAARSTIAIAPLVRRSHCANKRRGARSRSSIERRDRRSRSTSGALVDCTARRTSVLPDLMHFLVK